MKELVKYSKLLEFYRPLFTKTQLKYLDLYFNNDYSLQEIAEEFSVSKVAIHDTISKSKNYLNKLENDFKLLKKYEQRQKLYKKINDSIIVENLKEVEEI